MLDVFERHWWFRWLIAIGAVFGLLFLMSALSACGGSNPDAPACHQGDQLCPK